MARPTWDEIRTEVEDEYDLSEETFVTPEELLAYANEAIEMVESSLMKVENGAYFKDQESLALVNGTSLYDLPDTIYANKVRKIIYNDGSRKYVIARLKRIEDIPLIDSSDDYMYEIVNNSVTGTQIKLHPASRETSASNVTIYFIRNANRLVEDDDELDIPEAKAFIKQYVIEKAMNKERMTPDAQPSPSLVNKHDMLIDALTDMVPDEDNKIPMDLSYYEDFVGDDF